MQTRRRLGMAFALIWCFTPVFGASATSTPPAFGPDILLAPIPAPPIARPADWIGRPSGDYTFTFIDGNDQHQTTQVERHEPAARHENLSWRRHIGSRMTEELAVEASGAVVLRAQVDHQHGFRVEFSPGPHIPAPLEPGSAWHSASTLEAHDLDAPDKQPYRGTLAATHRYLGAYRVRVPAGEFDAILIEDDYQIRIGPLKADDTRHLLYAEGVGIVAEIEGLHASALLVIRLKEESTKVLQAMPPAGDSAAP